MTEKKIEEMTCEQLFNKVLYHCATTGRTDNPEDVDDELWRRSKLYEQSQQLAVKELEAVRSFMLMITWGKGSECMQIDNEIDRRISALKKGESK